VSEKKEKNFEESLNELNLELGKIIALIISENKITTASDLMNKYKKQFHDEILVDGSAENVAKKFNPWVNNIMSSCEALGIPERQFRSIRKLILNEMYSALKEIFPEAHEIILKRRTV